MSRSKWKGNFISLDILKFKNPKTKIWNRSLVIPKNLIGKTASVYSGKYYKKIKITREKVGFKFGEFSFTRVVRKRIKEKKLKLKKKNK